VKADLLTAHARFDRPNLSQRTAPNGQRPRLTGLGSIQKTTISALENCRIRAKVEILLRVNWKIEGHLGMPMDQAKEWKATVSRQNWIFYLSLSLCVFVGVLCIVGSVIWKRGSHDSRQKLLLFELGQSLSTTAGSPAKPLNDQMIRDLITESDEDAIFGPDIVRDLGIALLISVFVTFSIERYASSRLREHITYDVLSAAYAKVVPEKIYTQVADNIFRSNVYRRNWEAHISDDAGQLFRNEGIALITATYSYDLENLNEHAIRFSVVASVDLDVPPPRENIPSFKSFEVCNEQGHSLADPHNVHDLLKIAPGDRIERRGNLALRRDKQVMELTAHVRIPGRRKVTVRYRVQRAIRVPGDFVLTALVPADGIKIIITVDGFKLTVVPLHPHREALLHPQEDTWTFDAGILPYQSFRLASEFSTEQKIEKSE
jgi:hypothetical protein